MDQIATSSNLQQMANYDSFYMPTIVILKGYTCINIA